MRWRLIGLTAGLAFAAPGAVSAADLFGPETLTVIGDLRLTAVDGERSFLDGGFGKARFGADGGFRFRPKAAEAELVWQPRFAWGITGTVVAAAQDGQDHAIDLIEAFVAVKPLTQGNVRLSGRAGIFWPPVSLEHQSADWHVAETITPSAINSWIGEEVKVGGVEATVTADLGEHRLIATASAFELNDTAATLLAFRGWALSDYKATVFGHIKVAPLNGFMQFVQSPQSRQMIELDDRVGFYGKLEWRPPVPAAISLTYYDNRGDPQAVRRLQWGWDTRFWNLGAVVHAGDRTTLTAQAMTGNTRMGFPSGGVIWVDTDFRAGFLMATRKIGEGAVSARLDLFGTRNHGSKLTGQDDEDGWSLTAAWRKPLTRATTLRLEALHIDSDRDARVRAGASPHQRQTLLQAALRVTL